MWRRGTTELKETGGASARRRAFDIIARRHEAELLRVARRLCGPAHGGSDRAADLVQDVLLRAYETLLDDTGAGREYESPEETRRVRSWLLRALTNGFINDYQRRRKWEAPLTVDALTIGGKTAPTPDFCAPPPDMPGVRLLSGTLDERLERALLALPNALRLCVVLVDMEGMEYAEAAAALGVPIGTIRSRLSRARLRLYDLLADYARDLRLR